jgi:GDP-L-fucose synthase
MCQAYRKQYNCDFISVMPNNIYGPGDHFEIERSHVIPALMRRFYDAVKDNKKEITLWGTGVAIREFIHCDDLADASLSLMNNYSDKDIINVGTVGGISIKDLSTKIKEVSGFKGRLVWDSTKPDGMPIRLLDTSKLQALGWKSEINFDKGLRETYKWFTEHVV